MKKSIFIGAITLVAVGATQAAVVVNWQSAGVISNGVISAENTVSTLGTLEYAYNLGAVDTYTVNTVQFDGTAADGVADMNGAGNVIFDPVDNGGSYDFSDLTGDFGSMLDSGQWGTRVANPDRRSINNTITLGNLVSGQEYLVQIFSSDTRGNGYQMTLDDSTDLDSFNDGFLMVDNGDNSGAYAIGKFTADSTEEAAFSFKYIDDTRGNAVINAIQIRAIPEPATLGLVAAFGGGILFVRRRLCM